MRSPATGGSVAFGSRPAALRRKYCLPPAGWASEGSESEPPLTASAGTAWGLRFHSTTFRIQSVL